MLGGHTELEAEPSFGGVGFRGRRGDGACGGKGSRVRIRPHTTRAALICAHLVLDRGALAVCADGGEELLEALLGDKAQDLALVVEERRERPRGVRLHGGDRGQVAHQGEQH